METITFKIQGDVVKRIDAILKPMHFNNRTEFIRESIREKLNNIEKDIVLEHLLAFKGASKTRVNDKELHKIREMVAKGYAKRFGVKLN